MDENVNPTYTIDYALSLSNVKVICANINLNYETSQEQFLILTESIVGFMTARGITDWILIKGEGSKIFLEMLVKREIWNGSIEVEDLDRMFVTSTARERLRFELSTPEDEEFAMEDSLGGIEREIERER